MNAPVGISQSTQLFEKCHESVRVLAVVHECQRPGGVVCRSCIRPSGGSKAFDFGSERCGPAIQIGRGIHADFLSSRHWPPKEKPDLRGTPLGVDSHVFRQKPGLPRVTGEIASPRADVRTTLGFRDEKFRARRGGLHHAPHEIAGVTKRGGIGGGVSRCRVKIGADPVQSCGLGPIILGDDR